MRFAPGKENLPSLVGNSAKWRTRVLSCSLVNLQFSRINASRFSTAPASLKGWTAERSRVSLVPDISKVSMKLFLEWATRALNTSASSFLSRCSLFPSSTHLTLEHLELLRSPTIFLASPPTTTW